MRSGTRHYSAGPREPADLHAVLKEGLLLGYHGSRTKALGFELNLQTDCDPQVSQVEMVGPEILRVIINSPPGSAWERPSRVEPWQPAGRDDRSEWAPGFDDP